MGPGLSADDRRLVGLWAAHCAERVLAPFEAKAPNGTRWHPVAPGRPPAVESTWAFARGQMRVGQAKSRAGRRGSGHLRRRAHRGRLREHL